MTTIKCFVCQENATQYAKSGDCKDIECSICGRYKIGDSVSVSPEQLVLLRGYLAEKKLNEVHPKFISECFIKELETKGKPTVEKRLELILQQLHKDTQDIGNSISLVTEEGSHIRENNAHKYMALGYCSTCEALQALLESLEEQKFILLEVKSQLAVFSCRLTSKAFSLLESKNKNSNTVFVAMSFDDTLNTVYESAIKVGIENAGYIPIRIDKKQHNNKICDEIISEIKKAKFIIADFTHHKNGVYYETGFAQGLGLPVIWTCREDDIGDLHFDIQQYNCIVWEKEKLKDFAEKITHRIGAII